MSLTAPWRALACALLIVAVAGCSGLTPQSTPVSQKASLLPDYHKALVANPDNLLGFFQAWLSTIKPAQQSADGISYAVTGSEADIAAASDRLLAGYEAFCSRNNGKIGKSDGTPGQRCVNASGQVLAQLGVNVAHGSSGHMAGLEFSVETGESLQRALNLQRARYTQVAEVLSGNGPIGGLVLTSGESFDVARFGRLSGPDYYALNTPTRGLVPLTDILSARWGPDGLRLMLRDGSVVTEPGPNLTPAKTLVRVVPGRDQSVEIVAPTFDVPFRFVAVNAKSKHLRQIRLRDTAQILEITVSPKPPRYAAGPLDTRFDKKDQEAFDRALTADARKAALKLNRTSDRLDIANTKLRDEIAKMGRTGPCSIAQSESGLKTGDVSVTEYYVCAEYRRESDALLQNGGQVTPDKTPLVFLGRAARAPWYNFDGVLR